MRELAKVKMVAAVLAGLMVSGCCMGQRGWSYEESARIDSVIARGLEPLDEGAASGMPLPNVPQTPSAPLALSSHSFATNGPKRVSRGARSGKAKTKSKKTRSESKQGSGGFSFSGF